jgi:hypothetical protein
MGFLSEAQELIARGEMVGYARFVRLEFLDLEMRLWEEFGDIEVGGETWQGGRGIGSMGETGFGSDDSADVDTYTLTGVTPEMMALALDSAPVRGRPATKYGCFFRDDLSPTSDGLFVLKKGFMDTLEFGGQGASQRTITLKVESYFVHRNLPANQHWSDTRQKKLFPGDRGFEHVAGLINKTVQQPIAPAS